MRKYLFFAAILILVGASCRKDNLVKATVVDTGDIALDGCGYLLKIEGEDKMVRPTNLPSAYTHDGYKVKIKFDRNGEGEVCSIYPQYEYIELVQLTKVEPDLN